MLALCAACLPATAHADWQPWRGRSQEVQYSNEEFKRLDTFEAHTLTKADKVFVGKDYKRAAAEYDSFVLEFPRSKAIAYALLRKARCLQLIKKRFEAVKEYREVLDYFPNAVSYAAPALFYTGLCHWENADEEKAMQAWAKMAADEDYSRHPLAAWAINKLADHLATSDELEKAIGHYKQVAVDFRRSSQSAARYAIDKVIAYYVRTAPDEPALRAFYEKVGTFNHSPRKIRDETLQSRDYWRVVRDHIRRNSRFTDKEASLRERYFRYWAGLMDGKFADWDDYQIELAGYILTYEKNVANWMQRLDNQFKSHQKPGDYDRVIQWIRVYRAHKPKVMQYYNLLQFAKMSNKQIRSLLGVLFDQVGDAKLATSVFGKLKLEDMPDAEKVGLAHYLYHKDAGLVKIVCQHIEDKELGLAELFRFYHWAKDAKNGVPLADQVAQIPRFAQEALYKKAQLLHGAKKYKEAIAAYQQADNPPDNLWAIADCYARLGQLERAVGQLREVEAFFKDHASEAAIRIARLYKSAGKKQLCIAAFRGVLKKYPKSGQSSEAHQQLERMGIRIGGGVDANH